ncbi:hypothetical protein MTP99_007154 [Tenebrio molitor]|nr:hypothetical protein MTP99_007154 [Tenebrio molitor]
MKTDEEVTDDENYEPQVTSNNPTERIMARRLRIQRRVEALRKQKEAQEAAGEDTTIESEVMKTSIELQIEKSMGLLEKLMQDGEEHVTNVRIATEARETDRREREGIGKEKLLKQLEEEAEEAAAMFNEIASKWSGIMKYNDPLHINEDIGSQKERCDEVIRQKDAIINDLKEKLRKAEINFAIDQRRQIEDINSITRRIENQIIVMRKAYRQELQMIEEVILTDRQVQIETNNKKWEELYKKRDQEEKSDAEQRSEDYWKFVKEMENLNRDFQELYRETNINLENDLDDLQREMERIKTEATMNSEKLDYNYQILKKREDENLIIKSQQKRRINKLQDIINSLRKKNSDYHAQTMQQIEKLSAEVKKLSKNVLDIEKQADHIAAVNNVKFKKIWAMNKARTDKLFKRILDIDKVLYEQQLGLLWNPPEHKIPSKNDMESYRTAISQSQMNNKQSGKQSQLLQQQQSQLQPQPQQLRVPGSSMLETISGVVDSETENENNHFYKRTLNHILNLLADKTGFLIEEELNAILEPYLEYEKTLVKVDNVFAALNINQRGDIDLLLEFFLPYMFCPICNVVQEKTTTTGGGGGGDDESLMHVHEMDPMTITELTTNSGKEFLIEARGKVQGIVDSKTKAINEAAVADMLRDIAGLDHDPGGTVVEFGPFSVTLYDDNLRGECKGPEKVSDEVKEMESKGSVTESHTRVRLPCQYHHPLMISSVYVLKALKEFLGKYHIPKSSMPTMSARLSYKRSTVSRLVAAEDIEAYWEKYTQIFPEERETLWDNLLEGLNRYHQLLKARKLTSEEVMNLRRQNTELHRVFANYIGLHRHTILNYSHEGIPKNKEIRQ